jgi:hypothetical protein
MQTVESHEINIRKARLQDLREQNKVADLSLVYKEIEQELAQSVSTDIIVDHPLAKKIV